MTATLHRHSDGREISRGKSLQVMMSWARRHKGVSLVQIVPTSDGGALVFVFYRGDGVYGRIKFASLEIAHAYYSKRSKLSTQPVKRSWFGGCAIEVAHRLSGVYADSKECLKCP